MLLIIVRNGERCLSERTSFVFETVFSATDKIDFLIRAKHAGFFYKIVFHFNNQSHNQRITNSQ